MTEIPGWKSHNQKNMRYPENKELITLRANLKFKKISIRVSIGLVICDILGFKKHDRINIYTNKKDRNILLVKKISPPQDGYKLSYSENSNFLTFDFVNHFYNDFKIKETVKPFFEFTQQKILLIDLSKLKWEK